VAYFPDGPPYHAYESVPEREPVPIDLAKKYPHLIKEKQEESLSVDSLLKPESPK
jgi:hypothetical protein